MQDKSRSAITKANAHDKAQHEPPGWNLRYGVILYTFPFRAVHASLSDLWSLRSLRVYLPNCVTPCGKYQITNQRELNTKQQTHTPHTTQRAHTYSSQVRSRALEPRPVERRVPWLERNFLALLGLWCRRRYETLGTVESRELCGVVYGMLCGHGGGGTWG